METKNNNYVNQEERKTKYERIMEGCGIWTSFYRANPHRFLIEYLGMTWLRPFQQMLVVIMFYFTYVMIFASRGMGKTMVVAAAICAKAILYPGIEICIAAGNRGQSVNVLEKIVNEFMARSLNLQNEIEDYSTSPQNAYIKWANGSMVKVVTARDSARSARTNWMIADEFVQIKKTILDKVLRKFKAGQRRPGFYDNPEYANWPKEPNAETYISSAYYKWHYSWAKFKSFVKSMAKGESYLTCGFPYQLPVREGYYPAEQIREEMQESDFDSIAWSMEMDTLFWGESANAFFAYGKMENARKLPRALYPIPYYKLLNDSKFKPPEKQNGEIRIISMDVATSGGSKNDATAFTLLQMFPLNNGQYMRLASYMETMEGGHGQTQAIRMRQLYDDLQADFVVVDTNGVGMTVYDHLVQDLYDEDRGLLYEAWSCKNDQKMAERSKNPAERKIIYSIKANQKLNSDIAVLLRDCVGRGKLKLLIHETDGIDYLNTLKGYSKLTAEEQFYLEAPYYQTSAFINEAVNLDYEVTNGNIKVSEVAGARKDRYSSVAYANYIANEIEREMLKSDSRDIYRIPHCVSSVSF